MDGINMEDYMDVVYKCKFCSHTCASSSEMSNHVKEDHLQTKQETQSNHVYSSGSIKNSGAKSGSTSLAEAFENAVSAAVGKCNTPPPPPSFSNNSSHISHGLNKNNSNDIDNGSACNTFSMQVSNDMLNFNHLDKSLTAGAYTPLVPVSQSGTLSNTSTPDLSDLINLVKPTEEINETNNAKQTPLTLNTVVHLQSAPSVPQLTPINPHSVPSTSSTELSLNSSQYTVMAIQLQGYDEGTSSDQHQYVVSAASPTEPVNIPDNAETKEFLLCGLCKLAFTSMEDCQTHMQSEHKELMQGTGTSIGVQVGGAKRGRKKKSEMLLKAKLEPVVDPYDLEWLPSASEGNNTTHSDGRVRRRVKPPKALKEDYVSGKRTKKGQFKSDVGHGYKILCPMMSCKVKFKTEEGLKIHLACHNLQDSGFTCRECQAPHEFWKHLRMHLWRNHQVDVDLLTCDVCNYKTDTLHKMTVHKEIHTDDRPYTCYTCGKGFRQMSQMKNHQIIHNSQDGREGQWFASKKCDICDRIFANSKCLKKHKEACHSNLKPFQCPFCSHSTARKAMMQLHMRTHTGEKPFKCDVCAYTTGDHNSMRRHKMRHTGQKQYKCTLCPYTCIQSISLKQHMRHKHPGASGGIFQCTRCPFRTINQSFYNNHQQDHKKGLIPDKMIPAKLDLPKPRTKITSRLHSGSKQSSSIGGPTVMESLLVKQPQVHTVMSTLEPHTLSSLPPATIGVSGPPVLQPEVFNMQVTMLPEGDTQVNAEDMTRLSECPGLARTGVSSLQLIYATLSTISEQSDMAQLSEGRSALLTVELLGGIHTAVLSSMQDGVTVHSITYHLPASDMKDVAALVSSDDTHDKDCACGEVTNIAVNTEDEEVIPSLLNHTRDSIEIQNVKSDQEVFLMGTGNVIPDDNVKKDLMKVETSFPLKDQNSIHKKRKETEGKLGESSALREMLISGNTKIPMVDSSSSNVSLLALFR